MGIQSSHFCDPGVTQSVQATNVTRELTVDMLFYIATMAVLPIFFPSTRLELKGLLLASLLPVIKNRRYRRAGQVFQWGLRKRLQARKKPSKSWLMTCPI